MIDLRSDTVTRPSAAMRQAMIEAVIHYDDEPDEADSREVISRRDIIRGISVGDDVETDPDDYERGEHAKKPRVDLGRTKESAESRSVATLIG